MKILQVTHFGTTTNYGAVLQAFALQKALCALGHEPTLLKADFSYHNKIKKWYKSPFNVLKAWRNQRKVKQEELRHPRHFAEFIQKNMISTERVYHTIREVRRTSWKQFDAMITGSDQVWSGKTPSDLYFLKFGPQDALRFSYAASVGTKAHLSPQYVEAFQRAVQKFSAISVREQNALVLCEKAGVPAEFVPDPVFLFRLEDYEAFLHLPAKTQNQKICFIYLVSKNNSPVMDEVYRYCEEHQLTPVSVSSQNHNSKPRAGEKEIYPDIPTWIQLIRDAELVVTDSFHGAAFSILFGKKLIIFPKKDYDARLDMLDRCFGIGPAICRGDFGKAMAFQPDYQKIQKKIAALRDDGFRFLRQARGAASAISLHKCSGCGLCEEICPKHCISMESNAHGFLVPKINESQCIHCDLCRKSCPLNQPSGEDHSSFRYFYAVGKDKDLVTGSSSGGIFPLLAVAVLKAGGTVAGVRFDAHWNAVSDSIDKIDQLAQLQGSKYVQATIAPGLFIRLKSSLEQGKQVLFSGTPCQISAFRRFLQEKEYPNLLLIDCICHGAPSPELWCSYLTHLGQKHHFPLSQIKSISFRNKINGWHNYALHIEDQDGRVLYHCGHKKDPYLQLFIHNLTLRESCYHCAFKKGKSGADLTLGDFWKLKKIAPELDNQSGASVVISHTSKGLAAFQQLECEKVLEMTDSGYLQKNSAFFSSAEKDENADRFFAAWIKNHKEWIDDPSFFLKKKKKSFIHKISALWKSAR